MDGNDGQVDDLYLSTRLAYNEQREEAERAYQSVTPQFLWAVLMQVWARAFVLTLLVLLIAIPTVGLGLILLPVAWILPWFPQDNVYGGPWHYSVENGWHLHESAFSLVAKQLQDKQVPAQVTPRLISAGVGETPRYYLAVRQGRHVGYVAVLVYGADLFVSWTMWREERPISVVWNYIKESLARALGKGTAFHEIVRHNPARALRESLHNATRAGVDAAVAGETGTIVGTFGHELTVESGDAEPPPVPTPAIPPVATVPPPPVTPPPPVDAPPASSGAGGFPTSSTDGAPTSEGFPGNA